jgi:hypothetical protein
VYNMESLFCTLWGRRCLQYEVADVYKMGSLTFTIWVSDVYNDGVADVHLFAGAGGNGVFSRLGK